VRLAGKEGDVNREPVVHDWNELPVDRPMELIERQRIVGERAMISRVRLAKGFVVATHRHDNEQLAVVLSGRIRFTLGPEAEPSRRVETLTAGQTLLIPSGAPHGAEALEETVILDIFSPPSETTGVDAQRTAP
jgi:quercetin dioxygenase-like cupin family protein